MGNYENKLEQLRAERAIIREKADDLKKAIVSMLKTFHSDHGNTMITFDDMSMFTMGIEFKVNENVTIKKIQTTPEKMVFETYMKAGGSFGLQQHDVKEAVKILEGHLIESRRNDKIYNVGEVVKYEAHEIHKPYANLDSVYLVTFHL